MRKHKIGDIVFYNGKGNINPKNPVKYPFAKTQPLKIIGFPKGEYEFLNEQGYHYEIEGFNKHKGADGVEHPFFFHENHLFSK